MDRNQSVLLFGMLVALAILVGFGLTTDFTGRHRTSPLGPGDLPTQNPPQGGTIPWAVPSALLYPNATQQHPDNNRIFLSADPLETIAAHFAQALPAAERRDAGALVTFVTPDLEVELTKGGAQVVIAYKPVGLLKERSR